MYWWGKASSDAALPPEKLYSSIVFATQPHKGLNMTQAKQPIKPDRVIVIAIEQWCYMGERLYAEDQDRVTLEHASVIRVWGTTAGIGEIAINGPTTDTKLDPCGKVTLPMTSVVAIINCTY